MFVTHENSLVIYEMAKLNVEKWENHALMKSKSLVGSTPGLIFYLLGYSLWDLTADLLVDSLAALLVSGLAYVLVVADWLLHLLTTTSDCVSGKTYSCR